MRSRPPAARFAARRTPMARLPIIEFPDPRLRTVAKPVERSRHAHPPADRRHVRDHVRRPRHRPGRDPGRRAPAPARARRQRGQDASRWCSSTRRSSAPRAARSTRKAACPCPGIYADVKRAESITVRALDRDGQPFELSADGLLAVCIQHEMDHLAGKVFVDYLSPLKRELVQARSWPSSGASPKKTPKTPPDGACASFSPARRNSRCRPCARPPSAAKSSRVYTQPDRPAGPRPAAGAVAGEGRGARARPAGVPAGELQGARPRASSWRALAAGPA